MSKIVITEKEIDKLKAGTYSTIEILLDKYKEEDYKEVFIYDNQVFIYDIYLKDWFSIYIYNTDNLNLKRGFYNYSVLNEVSPFKNLDKDKMYEEILNGSVEGLRGFLKYNKELEVWENIIVLKKSILGIHILTSDEKLKDCDIEDYNKLLLISELLS